jgi:hypothetical protein
MTRLLLLIISSCFFHLAAAAQATVDTVGYPSSTERHRSPGNTSYYIHPRNGNDNNSGTNPQQPWKTFRRINQMVLSPGDIVTILGPGDFHESLVLIARGTDKHVVQIKFASGRYNFFPDQAIKKQLHISNTNDRPYEPKAIALMMDSTCFVQLEATGAQLIFRGKMIETYLNACHNISLNGLTFDYQRPTVSELTITGVSDHYAAATIHADSKFNISDSLLTWIGEGWSYQPGDYWQVLNPVTNDLSRMGIDMKDIRFSLVDNNKVHIHFSKNPGFRKGCIYQNRDVTRDCAGIFMQYSSNVSLKNINIHFMHGMGVVSQYCRDIKMDNITVAPAAKSGRTCAAWADILHFSGCSGKIAIANSYLSAANDDAVNIHGTHLKVIKMPAPNKVQVRFMHPQTYGFNAFAPQDSIAFIQTESLLPVETGQVTGVEKIDDKEFLLTLKDPVPASIKAGDAIENTTATPEAWIHHTTITRIPTRGILATTRRRVLIEHNSFSHVHMSGIFVNDDASGWFESGIVKDMRISHNKFATCGEPVINIHPENTVSGKMAVHANISIKDNVFSLKEKGLLSAKSTANITLSGNLIHSPHTGKRIDDYLKFDDCSEVRIFNNKLLK